MSARVDTKVDAAADRLERFVRSARSQGGFKAKIAQALEDDPEFLRKLKPRLIAARARGTAPAPEPAGGAPQAPSTPQVERPRAKGKGGVSPWLVVGAAFAAGVVAAKIIDWRGYAHPRR